MVLADVPYSGGTKQLAVGAGKDSRIYVVDRTNMGKYTTSDSGVYQELTGAIGCAASASSCVYSTPAFFNGTVFIGAVGDNLRAFPLNTSA